MNIDKAESFDSFIENTNSTIAKGKRPSDNES